MESVLQHAGLVVLYAALFLLNILIFAGVPGSWIALAAIVVYAAATRFSDVGWKMLLVMAGIAAAGEIVESLLGDRLRRAQGRDEMGSARRVRRGSRRRDSRDRDRPARREHLFGFLGAFAGAVVERVRLLPVARQGAPHRILRLHREAARHAREIRARPRRPRSFHLQNMALSRERPLLWTPFHKSGHREAAGRIANSFNINKIMWHRLCDKS